jgi:type II secretory pathway component PulC
VFENGRTVVGGGKQPGGAMAVSLLTSWWKKGVIGISAAAVSVLMIDIGIHRFENQRAEIFPDAPVVGPARERPEPAAGRRGDVQKIIAADMFQTMRKTPGDAAGERAGAPPPRLPLVLTGTARGGRKGPMAMVRDETRRCEGVYREEEEVGGARITKIHRDRIVVNAGGRIAEITMAGGPEKTPAEKERAGRPLHGRRKMTQ